MSTPSAETLTTRLAMLASGKHILAQQKLSGVVTPFYFITKTTDVYNADGWTVEELFEKYNNDLTNHGHGNIDKDGKIGTTEGYAVYTGANGVVTAGSLALAAATDVTADTTNTETTFVSGIAQDAKGKVTYTTKVITTATTTVAGITSLSSATNSTAENVAATPAAVKSAYDLAAAAIPASEKAAANGVATLDENGLVPASQLPSYVDDVIVGNVYVDSTGKAKALYTNEALAPVVTATGAADVAALMVGLKDGTYAATVLDGIATVTLESGKIYLDDTTNNTYRYTGVVATPLALISESLALGETATTAYRGDRGKAAYDHSLAAHARVDATKVSIVDENGENTAPNGSIYINNTLTTIMTSASSSANGMMSSTDKVKLDRCIEAYVGTTAPEFDCLYYQVISEDS